MRLAAYKNYSGDDCWGRLVDEQHLIDLTAKWPSMAEALAAGLSEIARAPGEERLISGATCWAPLVGRENRVFCIGVNYADHATEVGRDAPEWPSVFLRGAGSFVGHGANVLKPSASDDFDYEAELAVMIGKPGRAITENNAMNHVAGFTCVAENSVRDFQRHSRQVTAGKNFDQSGAIGPHLVTVDEIDDIGSLVVRGVLNGEGVQCGAVADMIYSVSKLISYISTFTTLRPGDLISTGTPQGVGVSQDPPRFLKAGDQFDVVIEGVGTLSNKVINEASP